MKLLLDQNLSPKLCDLLREMCERVARVRELGLSSAPDMAVWKFAKENEFIIVSKDSDFNRLSSMLGHPPKVIWIALGNCSTRDIHFVLQARRSDLIAFRDDTNSAILNVGPEAMPS